MSAGPKIEHRFRGLGREELGRLIRREAREALRIVTPEIKPGAKAKRSGAERNEQAVSGYKGRHLPGRNQLDVPAPNVRAVPEAAIVKIPHEPADTARALIARRESICAGCEHFNGVCTLVFPQVKGCRSLNRYRPGWLAFAVAAENACPPGRWDAEHA